METRSDKARLNIKLDSNVKDRINDILKTVEGLPNLSASDLLNEIKEKGYKSKITIALYKLLTKEEDEGRQTYRDQGNNDDMTIGIGLDIQPPSHNDAEAVLMSVNPAWDFKDMQQNINRPAKPLSDEEIKEILHYTLIGANFTKADKTTITFKGKVENLVYRLNKFVSGLHKIPFAPHELISLISMAFNTPRLIGPQLCEALVHYNETNDPMDVILQIMECSNDLYNKKDGSAKPATNGLQNRRMIEAALFLGKPEALHISYRQYKRIQAALATLNQTVVPINGHPIYSQPYGEGELTFKGGEELKKKELIYIEGKPPFITYYGSNKSETITISKDDLHTIVFSGDGDNTIVVESNSRPIGENNYPYLAGGSGSNRYEISSNAGHVLVHDLSGRGKITIDNKHTLQGIALATDDTGKNFQLDANGKKFDLKQTELLDKTNQLNITWGDDQNDITIPNFKSGQLNLVLAKPLAEMNLGNSGLPRYLPKSGNFAVVLSPSSLSDTRQLLVHIINPKGKLIREFQLAIAPNDHLNEPFQISQDSIAVLDSGEFVVTWGCVITTRKKYDETKYDDIQKTQTQGAICSENGVATFFDVKMQDGNTTCKLVTKWVVDEKGNAKIIDRQGQELNMAPMTPPQIFAREGGFAILYSMADIKNSVIQKVLMCQVSGNERSTNIATVNGYDVHFANTLAQLQDGSFAIALKDSRLDKKVTSVSVLVVSQNGKMIGGFPYKEPITGYCSVSLSPISAGFMLVIRDTNAVRISIFNGQDWSDEHKFSSTTQMPALATYAIKNNYVLISWIVNDNLQQMTCRAVIVDANNQMIGNSSIFTSGYSMPVHIGLTQEQDAFLMFAQMAGSQILYKTFILQTSNLPSVKSLQDNLQHAVTNTEEQKPVSSDKAFGNQLVLFKPKKETDDTDEMLNDFVLIDKNNPIENDEKPSNCLIM